MLGGRKGAGGSAPRQSRAAGCGAALFGLVLLCCLLLTPALATTPAREGEGQRAPCRLDAVVILAETADATGQEPLRRFQGLAQAANRYYATNSYGRVQFSFTFMDGDGSAGDRDWFSLGPARSAYGGNEWGLALAAVERAFAAGERSGAIDVERAIVVYSGAQLFADSKPLYATTFWQAEPTCIEVQGARGVARLRIANVILLSEADALGTWAHELGHTLCAGDGGTCQHLADRYSYAQPGKRYGDAGRWDLMGDGCRWGNPAGSSPVHMSSYTKVAAGWLSYKSAAPGGTYVLAALENQRLGDGVLKLDDPLSEDPGSYYLIEARDGGAAFGAPESGVVIYHVTYDQEAGHPVVEAIVAPRGDLSATRSGVSYQRPTLHGADAADGSTEYVVTGGAVAKRTGESFWSGSRPSPQSSPKAGLAIRLVAESFSPYRATVRIERYQAE